KQTEVTCAAFARRDQETDQSIERQRLCCQAASHGTAGRARRSCPVCLEGSRGPQAGPGDEKTAGPAAGANRTATGGDRSQALGRTRQAQARDSSPAPKSPGCQPGIFRSTSLGSRLSPDGCPITYGKGGSGSGETIQGR